MITLKKHWDTENGAEPPYEDRKITLEEATEIIKGLLNKTGSEEEFREKTPLNKIQFRRALSMRGQPGVVCHHITTITGQASDLKKLRELFEKVK